MSMICQLLGVPPAQAWALIADPALASDLARVLDDAPPKLLAALPPEQRKAFEEQYRAARPSMPGVEQYDADMARRRASIASLGPVEAPLDLQKSWHILHHLFTGHVDDAPAPGDALMSGRPLGEDVGYGPPRLHDPEETRAFDDFLQSQDLARLDARVDYREMTRVGVYSMPFGPGSDAEFNAELRDEVGSYFPPLRDYVHRMAARGFALLVWLS